MNSVQPHVDTPVTGSTNRRRGMLSALLGVTGALLLCLLLGINPMHGQDRQPVLTPTPDSGAAGVEPAAIQQVITGLNPVGVWAIGDEQLNTSSMDWGDIDQDGRLDVVVGNWDAKDAIYLNDGLDANGQPKLQLAWQSSSADQTTSVAWADIDNDEVLDLAIGHQDGTIDIYLNPRVVEVQGGDSQIEFVAQRQLAAPASGQDVSSLAWGDWDGDRDFDLAVGRSNGPFQVYENDERDNYQLKLDPANDLGWQSPVDTPGISSIAWGDWDGDDDLDLAVGNYGGYLQVFENEKTVGHRRMELDPANNLGWEATNVANTTSIAWGDWDGDTDIDLAVGIDKGKLLIYQNDLVGQSRRMDAIWESSVDMNTTSVAWGDWDADGDLDLAIARDPTRDEMTGQPNKEDGQNQVYENIGGDSQHRLMLNEYFGWEAMDNLGSSVIAWADIDGDSHLDLTVGNVVLNMGDGFSGKNYIYPNLHQGFKAEGKFGTDLYSPNSLALGDANNDGSLDLAIADMDFMAQQASSILYTNQNQKPLFNAARLTDAAVGVSWGDVDGDGCLDLAMAGLASYTNEVQLSIRNMKDHSCTPLNNLLSWQPEDFSAAVAWGDLDGDGDLDLATADTRINVNTGEVTGNAKIYGFKQNPARLTLLAKLVEGTAVRSVAWGDVDNDGDLDLALGSIGPNYLFRNDGLDEDGRLHLTSIFTTTDADITNRIVWADIDNDGFLDLVTGNGSNLSYQFSKVYFNRGGVMSMTDVWQPSAAGPTMGLAVGDVDNDGDLDVVLGNFENENQVYINISGTLATLPAWTFDDNGLSKSLAMGDVDNNGYQDIVIANDRYSAKGIPGTSALYANGSPANVWYPQQVPHALKRSPPSIVIGPYSDVVKTFTGADVNTLAPADNYAISWIRDSGTIPITYTLFHPGNQPYVKVSGYYSLNGGGLWHEAKPGPGSELGPGLASCPYSLTPPADCQHSYVWDVFGSEFFGQSDNVVLRLVAIPSVKSQGNDVAGPYQRGYVATSTFPFRVRGNQVRVVGEDGRPRPGANVYLLPATQLAGAQPASDGRGVVYHTDGQGYLQGRGSYNPGTNGEGDSLIALWPISPSLDITFTNAYTNFSLYLTSGAPTETGMAFKPALSGVTNLTVTEQNKLMLLNLDVSLEWDARSDPSYLDRLKRDLVRASEILFDLTNGQVALGHVGIFQARENWDESDILVYARNDLIPNANLGGIVSDPFSDTLPGGEIIPNAFVPGQVRIGATWNRYGEPEGTVGEDWPRALAHEIGHYALFLLDNYIGISPDADVLIPTDCKGSAMTDAYRQDYSEFLARDPATGDNYAWEGPDCQNTMAQRTTGRSDWETIHTFYGFMRDNLLQTRSGPSRLPLNLTTVEEMPVQARQTPLTAPFVYLTSYTDGSSLPLRRGEAQAYLFKTNDPATTSDDEIISEGTPNGPLIQARGAAENDRFCVINPRQGATRLGCIGTLGSISQTLTLYDFPGWQPQIDVTVINSTTLGVVVTQPGIDRPMHIEVLPSYRPTTTVQAVSATLNPVAGTNLYTQTFQFSITVPSGHVHIWVDEPAPRREAISEFFVSFGWDGNNVRAFGSNEIMGWDGNNIRAFGGNNIRAFGGNNFRAFGGNNFRAFGAPTSSGDGQVTIFNVKNPLEGNVAALLQPLAVPPRIPAWLTPIGDVYRYKTAEAPPPGAEYVMQFQYLERELPDIREDQLRIYYSPDDGQSWIRLEETEIDTTQNLASAKMQSGGLYALMATIATPQLHSGWEEFAYPDTDIRSVPQALASIAKSYTSVYWRSGSNWLLYDRTAHPDLFWLVNFAEPTAKSLEERLLRMRPLESYWIYVLSDTIPYVGIPSGQLVQTAAAAELPPATFYGWVEPTATYQPRAGDPVLARIGNVVCGVGTVQLYDPFIHGRMSDDRATAGASLSNLRYMPFIANAQPTRFVYKIQVRSDVGDGCGVFGRDVEFQVGDTIMPSNHPWGNSQACYHPLGRPTQLPYQCFTFAAPDLIVDEITATPGSVQVTIRNQGTASVPAGTGFWIDAYINPLRPPLKPNDTWQMIAAEGGAQNAQGLVWSVNELALPFEPGQTMTFRIGDQHYRADQSNFLGALTSTDRIYVQVDSANSRSDFGGVLENHEMTGQPYNNIKVVSAQ